MSRLSAEALPSVEPDVPSTTMKFASLIWLCAAIVAQSTPRVELVCLLYMGIYENTIWSISVLVIECCMLPRQGC